MLFRRGMAPAGACLPNGHIHNFEPRFDQTVDGPKQTQTYVRDVCVECGATVEREEKPVAIYGATISNSK